MSTASESTQRSRTFTWADPAAMAETLRDMSGLEGLQAIRDGRLPLPPIWSLMEMELVEVSEGRIVLAMTPRDYQYNPIGSVHGGVAATLLDSAVGCCINTRLPQGTSYTTLELKVNYVRPLTRETGRVTCEGSVIHLGSRIATAEGRVFDAAGKLYAHATTTCLIFRP